MTIIFCDIILNGSMRHISLLYMSIFFSCAKAGNLDSKGWAGSAYGCSKIGVTLLSFAQQREFDKDSREDIVLNAVSHFQKHFTIL